jgi:hypothetical protein
MRKDELDAITRNILNHINHSGTLDEADLKLLDEFFAFAHEYYPFGITSSADISLLRKVPLYINTESKKKETKEKIDALLQNSF